MNLFYRKFECKQTNIHPPIIILHGLFGLSDNWVTLAKELSLQQDVFILDQRNHGQSPHSQEFSIDILAHDLMDFLSQNQIEKANILGHSMGGKVAMRFSILFPQFIHRLIIADMGLRMMHFGSQHQRIFKLMNECHLSDFKSFQELEKWFMHHLNDQRLAWFVLKNIQKTKEGYRWKLNISVLENYFLKPMEPILDIDDQFDKPTLFIRGGKSNYITFEDESMIHQHFPTAFIQTIEDAGHWLHVDQPEEFLHILNSFL